MCTCYLRHNIFNFKVQNDAHAPRNSRNKNETMAPAKRNAQPKYPHNEFNNMRRSNTVSITNNNYTSSDIVAL